MAMKKRLPTIVKDRRERNTLMPKLLLETFNMNEFPSPPKYAKCLRAASFTIFAASQSDMVTDCRA